MKPALAALAAGRLVLAELDRLATGRHDFAFESALAGMAYVNRLKRWKAEGYRIEVIFLRLDSTPLALRRIASRIKKGGHAVPPLDVIRRFTRGWDNFVRLYRPLADAWTVYDNSGDLPLLLEKGP